MSNDWVQKAIAEETARLERQSKADEGFVVGTKKNEYERVVPGGFVCSMRLGKVER